MNNPPIVIAREGEKLTLPDDVPIFYVLASDGLYIGRNAGLFKSLVKSDKGPSCLAALGEGQVGVHSLIPKLSVKAFRLVWGFFREVHKRHHSEAAALLVLKPGAEEVDIVVVPQKVSFGSVKYENVLPRGETGIIVGDIHSHGNMGAFHSGTDTNDEEHKPGVHITLGKVNSAHESIEAVVSFVVDGVRCTMKPGDMLPLDLVKDPSVTEEIPSAWFSLVEKEKNSWMWRGDDRGEHGWFSGWQGRRKHRGGRRKSKAEKEAEAGKDDVWADYWRDKGGDSFD